MYTIFVKWTRVSGWNEINQFVWPVVNRDIFDPGIFHSAHHPTTINLLKISLINIVGCREKMYRPSPEKFAKTFHLTLNGT